MKINNHAKSEMLSSLISDGTEFLIVINLLGEKADVHLRNFWEEDTIPLQINMRAVNVQYIGDDYFSFNTRFRGVHTEVHVAIEDILILVVGEQQIVFEGGAMPSPPVQKAPERPKPTLAIFNKDIEKGVSTAALVIVK